VMRSQCAARQYRFANFSHACVNNLSEVSHSQRHKGGVFLRASTQRSADHVTAKACSVHRRRSVVRNQAARLSPAPARTHRDLRAQSRRSRAEPAAVTAAHGGHRDAERDCAVLARRLRGRGVRRSRNESWSTPARRGRSAASRATRHASARLSAYHADDTSGAAGDALPSDPFMKPPSHSGWRGSRRSYCLRSHSQSFISNTQSAYALSLVS